MKQIKPDKNLKKSMDNYYNSSQGYLNHLNKHRKDHFNQYIFFLKKYLQTLRPDSTIIEIGCGDGYAS